MFGMVKVSIKKNDPTESVSTFIGGRIRPSARTGGQPPNPRDFLGMAPVFNRCFELVRAVSFDHSSKQTEALRGRNFPRDR